MKGQTDLHKTMAIDETNKIQALAISECLKRQK
jgi:hypothetical protein